MASDQRAASSSCESNKRYPSLVQVFPRIRHFSLSVCLLFLQQRGQRACLLRVRRSVIRLYCISKQILDALADHRFGLLCYRLRVRQRSQKPVDTLFIQKTNDGVSARRALVHVPPRIQIVNGAPRAQNESIALEDVHRIKNHRTAREPQIARNLERCRVTNISIAHEHREIQIKRELPAIEYLKNERTPPRRDLGEGRARVILREDVRWVDEIRNGHSPAAKGQKRPTRS